ncbi:hypothetical protein D6C80_08297, partial [Aureobasidium pullulans]
VWFSALDAKPIILHTTTFLYNVFFHLFDIEGCVDDIPLSLLIHSFCQPLRLFTHQPFFYHNFYEERPKSEQRRHIPLGSFRCFLTLLLLFLFIFFVFSFVFESILYQTHLHL